MLLLLACTHEDHPGTKSDPEPASECVPTVAPSLIEECPSVCAGEACTLDLSADTVHLSGTVAFGGTAADESPWELSLSFSNEKQTHSSSVVYGGPWALDLAPGTYDVSLRDPLADYPVQSGLVVTEDADLDLIAEAYHLSGMVTYGGAPASLRYNSLLTATEQTTGGTWHANPGPDYSLTLPPGIYDLDWSYDYQPVYVASDVVVAGDTTHDIDVPLVSLSGNLTYQGERPPVSPDPDYLVLLADATGRVLYTYGDDGTYSIGAPPGTYDVSVGLADQHDENVFSGPIPVASRVVLTEDTTLDLDAEVVSVTGTDTFGRAWPDTAYQVVFTNPETGWAWSLDATLGEWSGLLPKGEFDVSIAMTGSGTIPVGTYTIDADTSLRLEPNVVRARGTVSRNGAPAASTVTATSVDGATYTCEATDGDYALVLPPGEYRFEALDVPLSTESVTADTTLDLSVCTRTVTGTVTLDGAAPDGFSVRFTSAAGATYSADGENGAYRLDLPLGSYTVEFYREYPTGAPGSYADGWFPSGACVTVD